MGIYINTNTNSEIVQQNLSSASSGMSTALERLSTGYKINKAADDASGLTISQSLTAQSNGSSDASTNAQNGINLLQTSEGDLGVIQTNLQRVRDLAVQSANGTNNTAERTAIQDEVQQRVDEISRLANSSSFNGISLLNGNNTSLTLQIGANYKSGSTSLNTLTIGTGLTSATATSLGINKVSAAFATAKSSASYIGTVDTAIAKVSTQRATIGALQNRLTSAVSSLAVRKENIDASNALIQDTDVASEASTLTQNQILEQTSTSLLAQANQSANIALSLI